MVRFFMVAYWLSVMVVMTTRKIPGWLEYALSMACLLAWLVAFCSLMVPVRFYVWREYEKAARRSAKMQRRTK